MELLAPVGSKESFITAIRAGANAVYMGVPDFNARVSAANINLFDLQVLIDHAHQKNVKVYLALNTLIKHEEISDVIKRVEHIEKLSPDAVIVQDLGVSSIIRKYYPGLKLHASTQMAVHNRMGVDFLAGQGFERVIMARELSFAELKIIANGAPAGIEVFCHGALCFCVSGMCLFSSFIGGLSGNRGRCTQPCRRLWQNGKKRGYIFSPRDLELAEHIGKLKSIGITSLKIEGRMRSSEYVFKVVKAYRMLIDAPESGFVEALKEAKAVLSEDAAREKTSCLFSGRGSDIFQPKKAQCLGNLIGSVAASARGTLTLEFTAESAPIAEGDRLRLSNPSTDTTIAFKVKEFTREGNRIRMPFEKAGEFAPGNPVYKTVDTAFDQKNLEKEIDAIYEDYKKANPRGRGYEPAPTQAYTALISNTWKEIKKAAPQGNETDLLWVRFDDADWLKVLAPLPKDSRPVYYLKKENLFAAGQIPDNTLPNLAVELPPFIGQRDLDPYRQAIAKLAAAGVNKWVLNNISQFGFFKDMECELTAGQFMYTWNAYTAAYLSGLGVKYFAASWEDDFLNIRKMCAPGLGKYALVYLFGYPPIVRSRLITEEMIEGDRVSEYFPDSDEQDAKGALSFLPVFESGLALLVPERPVNIFTARRKLKECAVSNFGIDLSFLKPDKKLWNTLFASYGSGENSPDSVKFNFKRGIK